MQLENKRGFVLFIQIHRWCTHARGYSIHTHTQRDIYLYLIYIYIHIYINIYVCIYIYIYTYAYIYRYIYKYIS